MNTSASFRKSGGITVRSRCVVKRTCFVLALNQACFAKDDGAFNDEIKRASSSTAISPRPGATIGCVGHASYDALSTPPPCMTTFAFFGNRFSKSITRLVFPERRFPTMKIRLARGEKESNEFQSTGSTVGFTCSRFRSGKLAVARTFEKSDARFVTDVSETSNWKPRSRRNDVLFVSLTSFDMIPCCTLLKQLERTK